MYSLMFPFLLPDAFQSQAQNVAAELFQSCCARGMDLFFPYADLCFAMRAMPFWYPSE